MRPLLFVDVDGPLIPFGGTAPYPTYGDPTPPGAHPLLSRLDPGLGPRLMALGCELVWATTWMSDANDVLAPRLGLPRLPVVDWPDEESGGDTRAGLHWKTRTLSAWAGDRPYVWLDDEITAADRAWTAAHHPAPTLLRRVDPRRGLAEADFTAVGEWSAEYVAGRS
ncbi:HAD domain-containing protein [Streptomyces sp. NPDC085481]|uniref:HAD domain-containing protein n=1 Tax=Streptomyces sp. NPDC085481 TaxID=3365727 RepID=UPI0037D7DF81